MIVPAKNSIKIYVEGGYYHIYNRGVEKRDIFKEDQDYGVFLSYLKDYLLPKDEEDLTRKLADQATSYKEKGKIAKLLKLNNFANEIILIAYCLMPNHIHLLLKQNMVDSIDRFMNSLCIRYSMFFNHKYHRVGTLFQDVYKAVLVESEEQLLYLTAYIHRNPLPLSPSIPSIVKSASQVDGLRAYFSKPSSLPEYLGQRKTEWVHPEEILPYFSKTNPKLSYQSFVEQTDDISPVQNLIIDF